MGTISLTVPVTNTAITAAVFSNAYTIVQSVVNGNLDTANWASGKIFDSTKLMQNGADTRHAIGWTGSQWDKVISPTRFYDATLGSSQASIDIQNIPQTHQGLLVLLYARGDKAASVDVVSLRINSDSGANYDRQFVAGNAATTSAAETFGATQFDIANMPANTAPANVFGALVLNVPNYVGIANNKIISALTGEKHATTTGGLTVSNAMAAWRSNSAVTQLTLLASGGNFVAGTRATLYLMP